MNLLARVRSFVQDHHLLTTGDGVVVGVSGGPDSLCLLHLLLRLRDEYALALHVAHLHHGARGADADADAAFVSALAHRWGLPVTVVRRDVPAIAAAHKLAFEEAARRVRYTFLAQVAQDVGATRVAVGHNADDQAETVLMHLLRGAGPAGLRGMRPAAPLTAYRLLGEVAEAPIPSALVLIRPLLSTPRAEVERYCAEEGLEPRFDRSNLDTTYFRNRLRHELLPLLETANPNIRRRLVRTAEVVAADYDLLSQILDQVWDEVVVSETAEAIFFDRVAWESQHRSLQRALVRRAAYRLRPHLRDVSFVHVENAVRVARAGKTGGQATLPGGLALTVGYDRLVVAGVELDFLPVGPTLPPTVVLDVAFPGITPLLDTGWFLEAVRLEEWNRAEVEANTDRWTAYLDGDRLGDRVLLRTRRQGDRFRPHGMGGHAPRLTDWMINAKLPRLLRDRLPLLVAGGEIVWVCGYRVAETVIVGPETRHVVRFRLQATEAR